MSKKLLGEYAFVRSGYTHRSSLKYAREGDTSIIQMADSSELVLTSTENLARANLSKISSRYLLKAGDLVMRSRGLNNSAMLISNPPERLICIAPSCTCASLIGNCFCPVICIGLSTWWKCKTPCIGIRLLQTAQFATSSRVMWLTCPFRYPPSSASKISLRITRKR